MKKIYLWILLYISFFLLTGCVGIGGEQIALSHKALIKPTQKFTEKLTVSSPATDLREEKDRIGRATFTVFAITTGGVKTTSPVGEQMVDQIIDALSSIGYQVSKKTNNSENTATMLQPLTLKVAINEFWFKNYNWVYPIVPTWGDIKITLLLENSSGKKIFEKSYEGGDHSLCLSGHCAFESATKSAMTKVLNQIVSDFSSQAVNNLIASDSKLELKR
jgi:hypothetical protein